MGANSVYTTGLTGRPETVLSAMLLLLQQQEGPWKTAGRALRAVAGALALPNSAPVGLELSEGSAVIDLRGLVGAAPCDLPPGVRFSRGILTVGGGRP